MHSCVTSHKIHKVAARMVAERVGVIPSIANSPPEAGKSQWILQPMAWFLVPTACNQWVLFMAYYQWAVLGPATNGFSLGPTKVLRHKPWHSHIQMFCHIIFFWQIPFVAPQDLSNYLSTRVFNCGSVVCLAYWNLQARNVDLLHIINLQFIAVPPPNRRKFAQRKTYTTESLIT